MSVGTAELPSAKIPISVLNAGQRKSLSTGYADRMKDNYNQVVKVVAENPGKTNEEIADLATEHGISSGRVEGLLTEAVDQEDLLEFDNRYWVMRKEEYAFTEYDHPET